MIHTALILIGDEVLCLATRETLETNGFVVAEVTRGHELLQQFEQVRPRLVLLDGEDHNADAYSLCAQLRKLEGGENTPVIMMTGEGDVEAIHRAYEAGATDFVSKPVEWAVLAHRVRYLLRTSSIAEHLRRSEEKLAKAQRIAQLGWWEWDLGDGSLVYSQEFLRILGLRRDQFGGGYPSMLHCVPQGDRESLQARVDEALKCGTPFSVDHRILRADGAERIVYQQAEVSVDKTGVPIRLVGTIQDITERKQAEEQIRFLAYFDSLTGLPNRRQFTERLTRALESSHRHSRLTAVLFLDLDRFKRINDTLGHNAGDQLLQEVAGRLGASLRKTDCITRTGEPPPESVLARLGGDEFIVMLSEVARVQDAAKVARRVIDRLSEPFELRGQEVVVTTSIGISMFPYDGEDAESLLKNADTAMYHAKDQGRNNYQFYNQSMNATAFERLVLESNLRRALERDEFVLHYQPQIRLDTGEIFGAEALIRWHHPEMGLVPPGKFIPLAEETGLILPIGEWALRTACEKMREWQLSGLPIVRIAVNVSSLQFSEPNFATVVAEVLRKTGLRPETLDLEMTESILMLDVEASVSCLKKLKEIGVWLSVDDFGTGYSSLSYLRRFALDTLKVDQSFLRNVPDDPDHVAISTAIIALAQTLNLGVIAEGVESVQQLNFLRQYNCREAQGFLFSRPVPDHEFRKMLEAGVVSWAEDSPS